MVELESCQRSSFIHKSFFCIFGSRIVFHALWYFRKSISITFCLSRARGGLGRGNTRNTDCSFSGHKSSLSLPHFTKPIRGDPTKGPLIRRTVLRIKAFIFRISPLKTILHGCFILSAVWVLTVYVTVCFGAPVLSDHLEVIIFPLLCFLIRPVWGDFPVRACSSELCVSYKLLRQPLSAIPSVFSPHHRA